MINVGKRRMATLRLRLEEVEYGGGRVIPHELSSKEATLEAVGYEFAKTFAEMYFDNPLEDIFFGGFLRDLFKYLDEASSKTRSKEGLNNLKTLAEIKGLIDSIGINLASLEGAEDGYYKDLVRNIRKTKTVPAIAVDREQS